MARKKSSQQLLNKVIENLKKDILEYQDYTVLEELLTFIPKKYLIGALDEEEWGDYTKDVEKMYDLENSSIYEEREKK